MCCSLINIAVKLLWYSRNKARQDMLLYWRGFFITILLYYSNNNTVNQCHLLDWSVMLLNLILVDI